MPVTYPLATREEMQAFADHVDWKGIIVWTPAYRFLELAAPCDVDLANVNRLAARMRAGQSLDPLVLITEGRNVVGHEGRHRAHAALSLGILSVPVLVIPRDMPRVPQWSVEQRAAVAALNVLPERY